ncbi:MAG: hypothetical protein R3253_10075, partial [Longimicrobiales bacterium]|nr:hypothetical protein [Longimicrobiales bacterium]
QPLRGRIQSFEDHRIAMAFGILGILTSCDVEVDTPFVTEVSFPGFWDVLEDVKRARRRST